MSSKGKLDKTKSIQTLKRILLYIKDYRAAVLLSLFLAVTTVASTLYIPILTGQAVDQIVGRGQVDFQQLIQILKRILIVMAVTAVSQWLMNHINNTITYRVSMDIPGHSIIWRFFL